MAISKRRRVRGSEVGCDGGSCFDDDCFGDDCCDDDTIDDFHRSNIILKSNIRVDKEDGTMGEPINRRRNDDGRSNIDMVFRFFKHGR
jgi:hypothetical protein